MRAVLQSIMRARLRARLEGAAGIAAYAYSAKDGLLQPQPQQHAPPHQRRITSHHGMWFALLPKACIATAFMLICVSLLL